MNSIANKYFLSLKINESQYDTYVCNAFHDVDVMLIHKTYLIKYNHSVYPYMYYFFGKISYNPDYCEP